MSARDPIKVYDARWEVHRVHRCRGAPACSEATFAYARLLKVDTVTFARDARLAAGRVMDIGIDQAMKMGLRVLRPHGAHQHAAELLPDASGSRRSIPTAWA